MTLCKQILSKDNIYSLMICSLTYKNYKNYVPQHNETCLNTVTYWNGQHSLIRTDKTKQKQKMTERM